MEVPVLLWEKLPFGEFFAIPVVRVITNTLIKLYFVIY